jgi:ammonia channel protein AmtB
LGIDDPLDSSAVHLVNGVLGMLLLAFVARPSHVQLLTNSPCGGIFYTRLGWLQLGMQVLGEAPAALLGTLSPAA